MSEHEAPTAPEDAWVSVARPTVLDGLCVDWYRSVEHYEVGAESVLSVSRMGVLLNPHAYLHTIPDKILTDALEVHKLLSSARPESLATVRDVYVTHEREPLKVRRLRPRWRAEESPAEPSTFAPTGASAAAVTIGDSVRVAGIEGTHRIVGIGYDATGYVLFVDGQPPSPVVSST